MELKKDRFIIDRGVKKKIKICMECKKDMVWRKKWEANWNNVLFCSKRCKKKNHDQRKKQNPMIIY